MIHYHVLVKKAKYGMGLFAHKPGGKKGEVVFDPADPNKKFICWYAVGKRIDMETITTKDVQIPYAANTGRGTKIFNPYKTNDFPGRYANDPNNISKPGYNEQRGNCKLVFGTRGKFKNSAYLNATKRIKQGEEIVWSYGHGYWNKPIPTNNDYTGVAKRSRKRVKRYGQ